jgi:WD40 repeat protein
MDVYHTLREYYSPIRDSAAHIYHSALVTMPSCRLFELNSHEAGDVILRTSRRVTFNPELTHMHGNIKRIDVFAASQDGSLIACCRRGDIYIGKTASGEMEKLNLTTTDAIFHVCALQFSRDGHQLFSANSAGQICAMDLDRPRSPWVELSPARDPGGPIFECKSTFSPAGDYCVFIYGHTSEPSTISSSPIGDKYSIVLCQARMGSVHHLLHDTRNNHPSSTAIFTLDARYVIQAYGPVILVFDVARCALHLEITPNDSIPGAHLDIIALAAVSSTVCASIVEDGTVVLWDVDRGTCLRTLCQRRDQLPFLLALACSSSGSVLGILADNTVRLLDTTEGHVISEHSFPYHPPPPEYKSTTNVMLDVDHSRVYVAGDGEPLFFCSYQTVFKPSQASINSSDAVRYMCISADGRLLVSGAKNGSLAVWQTGIGTRIAEHSGEGIISAVALSIPSGRYVISTRGCITVSDAMMKSSSVVYLCQVNDTMSGKLLSCSACKPIPIVESFTLSADGKYLALRLFFDALLDQEGTASLQVFNVLTGVTLAQSPDHSAGYHSKLLFTPNGHTLVQDSFDDASIFIRDAKTLQVLYTLPYKRYSPDDTLLLSSCSNRVGRLSKDDSQILFIAWDVNTGLVEASVHLQLGWPREGYLFKHAYTWTSTLLLYATHEGVSIWNVNAQTIQTFCAWPPLWGGPTCASQDQSRIYTWSED